MCTIEDIFGDDLQHMPIGFDPSSWTSDNSTVCVFDPPNPPRLEILQDKVLMNGIDILQEILNIKQKQIDIERYLTLQLLEKKIPIRELNEIILEYLQ